MFPVKFAFAWETETTDHLYAAANAECTKQPRKPPCSDAFLVVVANDLSGLRCKDLLLLSPERYWLRY